MAKQLLYKELTILVLMNGTQSGENNCMNREKIWQKINKYVLVSVI